MKAQQCKTCGETNPEKFKGRMKGCCYECYKLKYKKYYQRNRLSETFLCLCGESNPLSFYANSKSKCKRCLSIQKSLNPPPPVAIVKGSTGKHVCRRCGKIGKEHFYKKLPYTCAECYNHRSKLYYYPFYEQLVKVQGGELCAICGKSPKELNTWRLAVDHDHATNLVRGLLCSKCNWTAGHFSAKMSRNLANYLQNPPAALLQIQFTGKQKKAKST